MRSQKGQLLVEAIIALGVATVIITGIVAAVISSLNSSEYSKNQNLASNYAQEGLDLVRNLKESDYITFSSLHGYYCINGGNSTVDPAEQSDTDPGCSHNVGDGFGREAFISQSGRDTRAGGLIAVCSSGKASVFVASSVSWTDSRCENGDECHKVELSSCFSNLNQVSNP